MSLSVLNAQIYVNLCKDARRNVCFLILQVVDNVIVRD